MKLLITMLAVVALAVVTVAVFALLNLRALIGVHQDRLVARVERVLGRPIAVGSVVPSWWPLGIRLRAVTVGEDASFGTEPFLAADGVIMAVRAWPLVHGRIEAAGVGLDRPRLTLARDVAGRWNVESLGELAASTDAGNGGAVAKERRRTARVPMEWVIGVALSNVYDGTLVLDDRHEGESRRLVLHHVRLRAADVHLGATARVRLDAAVFATETPDLHLDLQVPNLGQSDLEHAPFTARLELRDVDLAAASTLLGGAPAAAGRVERLVVDAEGPLEGVQAVVELRADDPALRIGHLPVGAARPLALRGRGVRAGNRVTIEDVRASIGGFELQAHGEGTLTPWRIGLAIASQAGGAVTLGDLRMSGLDGRVVFDRDGAALEPLRVALDDAPLTLNGWITGLAPPALDVRLDGRPFGGTLAADLALEPTGGARARVEASALDLAAAVARFAPELAGRIEGRGSGAAALTARVAGGAVVPGSVAGSGTLTADAARLRGVNIPDLVVAQIESIPLMPQLVSARTRSRYAELFASRDTVIESASLPFVIGRSKITTESATLSNPAYQITGKGWIDEAQEIRFHGTVLLGASVSRTLRDDVRAVKYLMADDGRITLPFVARGRLGTVWVEPDAKRLRIRGLTALLGSSSTARDRAAEDEPPRGSQREEPVEDQVIERLERMLHP